MAFGKKKTKKSAKKSRDAAVKKQLVQMKKNPLYPEKQESTLKEVLVALGTAALCLVLVGVITVNFSYATGNVPGNNDANIVDDSVSVDDTIESSKEEDVTEEEMSNLSEEEAEEAEEAVNSLEGDYIIPDSASRYISENELYELSKEELSYARNEIYARHGRRFKDESLQQYFDLKDWYEGTIAPENFSEGMLNDYEIENAGIILEYEKEMGYR